ncbi:putative immunity protein [Methanorbis rubei]|uniref:Imm-5-like domain-containing protein n=1 Tax=Methanorbis rubei TaxID=3028300 RepID=A0AAE4SC13_9EURY|nr:hypothetical protein [Methanocorpusculaceae archaeon Cs1]
MKQNKRTLMQTFKALQPLKELTAQQDRKTLILWALDCADLILPIFTERYPEDLRPLQAVAAARAWSRGEIKMPEARRYALASHNAATTVADTDPAACSAARAMGHVVGTVHVGTHSMAFASYAVNAQIFAADFVDPDTFCAEQCIFLMNCLEYWSGIDKSEMVWAKFLQK